MTQPNKDIWKREKFVVLSWETAGACLDRIARQVDESGFRPTTIIGISRGGLVLATFLANAYGLRDLQVLSIVRNTSEEKYSARGAPVLQWMAPLTSLEGKDVILADDISGDGGTLRLALDLVRRRGPRSVRTAVIVKNENSQLAPDYHAIVVGDWLIFPWERPAPEGAAQEPIRLG